MPEQIAVPVLFLSEPIVLPGMVVPVELDDAARAAVDAAQASESGKLLIAPRLDDRYPTHGVIASIVQVGRMPEGPKPPSCAVNAVRTSAPEPPGRARPCGSRWRRPPNPSR